MSAELDDSLLIGTKGQVPCPMISAICPYSTLIAPELMVIAPKWTIIAPKSITIAPIPKLWIFNPTTRLSPKNHL